MFNPSYISPRPDIEKLIPLSSQNLLDVGCSNGALSESIKRKKPECIVTGIEYCEGMARVAEEKLDKVYIGDANKYLHSPKLTNAKKFDCIIFADILEHLIDPWDALKQATKLLEKEGCIIVSIPNIRHIDTIYNLVVKGRWPYRERGIHDSTHLRFFTRKNMLEMIEGSNLKIEEEQVNYRIIERPHKMNKYSKYFALPIVNKFIAFQYIFRLQRK